MVANPKPFPVNSGDQLLRLLEAANCTPLRFSHNGVVFEINRIGDDIAYEPDPDYVLKVLHEIAGTWADLDIDRMIEDV